MTVVIIINVVMFQFSGRDNKIFFMQAVVQFLLQ